MTSSFDQPLEIKHDKIDPVVLSGVRRVDDVARKCGTQYFLAGAAAREIMLRHRLFSLKQIEYPKGIGAAQDQQRASPAKGRPIVARYVSEARSRAEE